MNQINPEHETETIIQVLKKNSDQWKEYFNQDKFVKKGIKQISLPDLYAAISSKDKSLDAIKQDCKDGYILFSERVRYKENLMAEIIHDADSKLVKQEIIEVKIPVYYWQEIREDEETEKMFQAFLKTEDKIKEIKSKLKSFCDNRTLYFYTPSEQSRKSYPLRSLGCFFDGSDFFLYADVHPGISWCDGRSFGVRVISQKPKASEKKVSP